MKPEGPSTCAEAVVAALGSMSDVAKNRTANAGQFSYRFASLADVLAVVRPILADNGLALCQAVTTDLQTQAITVHTWILHTSGERHDGGTIAWPMPQTAQAAGSIISYARRYAAMAALCIAGADDDDDAIAAPDMARARAANPVAASRSQKTSMANAFDAQGITVRGDRLSFVAAAIGRTVASVAEVTKVEAATVLAKLDRLAAGALAVVVNDDGTWTLNDLEVPT